MGETGLEVLRAVKEQLDPAGIMNPGKLLPADASLRLASPAARRRPGDLAAEDVGAGVGRAASLSSSPARPPLCRRRVGGKRDVDLVKGAAGEQAEQLGGSGTGAPICPFLPTLAARSADALAARRRARPCRTRRGARARGLRPTTWSTTSSLTRPKSGPAAGVAAVDRLRGSPASSCCWRRWLLRRRRRSVFVAVVELESEPLPPPVTISTMTSTRTTSDAGAERRAARRGPALRQGARRPRRPARGGGLRRRRARRLGLRRRGRWRRAAAATARRASRRRRGAARQAAASARSRRLGALARRPRPPELGQRLLDLGPRPPRRSGPSGRRCRRSPPPAARAAGASPSGRRSAPRARKPMGGRRRVGSGAMAEDPPDAIPLRRPDRDRVARRRSRARPGAGRDARRPAPAGRPHARRRDVEPGRERLLAGDGAGRAAATG